MEILIINEKGKPVVRQGRKTKGIHVARQPGRRKKTEDDNMKRRIFVSMLIILVALAASLGATMA